MHPHWLFLLCKPGQMTTGLQVVIQEGHTALEKIAKESSKDLEADGSGTKIATVHASQQQNQQELRGGHHHRQATSPTLADQVQLVAQRFKRYACKPDHTLTAHTDTQYMLT